MKQRIFLVHGWGGSPRNDWFPWVKVSLMKKGYEVIIPEMPETEHPKINPWVNNLSIVVGDPLTTDIFIGHSIGCQTILRYFEKLNNNQRVESAVLIAPWWFLVLDENEDQADADPWLNSFINFENVKSKAKKYICVFSDNDPFVPLAKNIKFFKQNLNPEIITKEKCGHFTESDGFLKLEFLPELIK